MLESLKRRPRARAAARLVGVEWSEELLGALRAYEPRPYEDVVGEPSAALLARIGEADVTETRRRLTPDLLAAWDAAAPATRERMKLIFGVHAGVESVLENTGLRADAPPEDVHAMARGPLAAGGDFWMADVIAAAVQHGGPALDDDARVLDFGCSSGRHLRVLQAWRPGVRWAGCDPNARAIAWAAEHLPGIEFFRSPQDPPLDRPDGSFDVVFAVSVWSHLGADAALAWLGEMRRLLRPGGVLVLTTQGFGSLAHYLRQGTVPKSYAVAAAKDLVARGHHYFDEFREAGDWGVAHAEWGMTYMTLEWLAERVTPAWEVVSYEPVRIEANQDLVVLRRR